MLATGSIWDWLRRGLSPERNSKRKQADTPRIQKGKAAKGKERESLRRLGGTGESDLEGKVGSKINSAPHNKK